MATARGVERSLRRNVVDLCWGAWSELGVSGWSRTHVTWAIDPEPLIVFTAIADLDPRLRDEALDWCIRNSRHVSPFACAISCSNNPTAPATNGATSRPR